MMKISVIAIFYKSAPYIHKCIDSILSQTEEGEGNFEVELIAVNDCSPDDTLAILNEYNDKRINIISHTRNKGISAARNSGMRHISGDAFYFIDGDDFLPSGALSALAKHFSADVDWVQGGYAICDEHDKVLSIKNNQDGEYCSHKDITANFDRLEFIYTHNRLINAKWKNTFFPIGKAHEDRFWNVQVYPKINHIINLQIPTYNYIVHPNSFSSKSRSQELYINSALELLEEMDKLEDCWHSIRDTFLITAIEKPLYLWKHSNSYRRSVLHRLKNTRAVSIDISSFPRFTKLIHRMITLETPDICIECVSKLYRYIMTIRKKHI